MAEVTEPGLYHTAGSSHLEGIDFAGKTGTAQQMSHEALEKTGKGKSTYPNVWFVGLVPRRNPELVVAVLWQQGEFSYYPARIGAKVVEAYVDKKRRLATTCHRRRPRSLSRLGAVGPCQAHRLGQRILWLHTFRVDISLSQTDRLWLRTLQPRNLRPGKVRILLFNRQRGLRRESIAGSCGIAGAAEGTTSRHAPHA